MKTMRGGWKESVKTMVEQTEPDFLWVSVASWKGVGFSYYFFRNMIQGGLALRKLQPSNLSDCISAQHAIQERA